MTTSSDTTTSMQTINDKYDFPSFPPSTILSSSFAFNLLLLLRINKSVTDNRFAYTIITETSVSFWIKERFFENTIPTASVSLAKPSSSKLYASIRSESPDDKISRNDESHGRRSAILYYISIPPPFSLAKASSSLGTKKGDSLSPAIPSRLHPSSRIHSEELSFTTSPPFKLEIVSEAESKKMILSGVKNIKKKWIVVKELSFLNRHISSQDRQFTNEELKIEALLLLLLNVFYGQANYSAQTILLILKHHLENEK